MVRRLVQEQEVRFLEKDLAQGDAAALTAGNLRHVRVRGRQAESVHRDLELAVELPRVRRLYRVLDLLVLGHELVALGLGKIGRHLFVQLVEALQQTARSGDGELDVAQDVPGRIEARILRQEPDSRSVRGRRVAGEVLVHARHDPQERRLPGPIQAEDADLGARIEREVNPLQDFALRRDDLPQILHRVNVLVGHRSRAVYMRKMVEGEPGGRR